MKLAELVTKYVLFKQAMGMRYQSEAGVFRSFCKAMGDIDIEEVTLPLSEAFLSGSGPITAFWHQKYKVLKGFYSFAMSRGYVGSSPLPKIIPKHPEPLTPHIYTAEELRRLLGATDSLETRRSPLQATTFRTILLTLYGTGLRISEALSLTIDDVRLSDSLLIVRNSKFFKTRLVPTGPHLTDCLNSYLKRRRLLPRTSGADSTFFSTRTGNALSYDRTRRIFRRLLNRAEIHRKDDAHYAPRIHGIRHYAEFRIMPSNVYE